MRGGRERAPDELRCQHDLLVKDVLTIGVVVDLARPLVADALACAVGGSPRDAVTFPPREDLDVQKILCHRAASAPSRSCSRICLLKPGETSNRPLLHALQQRITRGLARDSP